MKEIKILILLIASLTILAGCNTTKNIKKPGEKKTPQSSQTSSGSYSSNNESFSSEYEDDTDYSDTYEEYDDSEQDEDDSDDTDYHLTTKKNYLRSPLQSNSNGTPAVNILDFLQTSFLESKGDVSALPYVFQTPVAYPNVTAAPTYEYLCQYDVSSNYGTIKGIWFDSLTYNGNPTKVFAYLGIPNSASESAKVPAVVLVHGGGGTANPLWVDKWLSKGYAAIAIDTEGCIPNYPASGSTKHAYPGPSQNAFGDAAKPVSEQWMYHATTAAMLANSLLASLPQIDTNYIGVSGISWGGVVVSNTLCYDNRFAFAVPVYGTLNLTASHGWFKDFLAANPLATDLWDNATNLSRTKTKILWINGDSDRYFSPDATSKTSAVTENSRMLLVNNMAHNGTEGYARDEIYAFADSICKSAAPLGKITKKPTKSDFSVDYSLPQGIYVQNIRLTYTISGFSYYSANNEVFCNTVWNVSDSSKSNRYVMSATISKAFFRLPENTKAYYITITDSRNRSISTPLVEMD